MFFFSFFRIWYLRKVEAPPDTAVLRGERWPREVDQAHQVNKGIAAARAVWLQAVEVEVVVADHPCFRETKWQLL